MILATFLLVFSAAASGFPGVGLPAEARQFPADVVQGQSATSSPPDKNSQDPASPGKTPPAQNPSNPPSSTPSSSSAKAGAKPSGTKAVSRKLPHKKNPPLPDCTPAPASPTAGTSSPPAETAATSADKPSTQTNPTASQNSATNCPPKKIIVREGGSSEPSVQLVGGGGGDQAARSTNQLLESAEDNLKKVDGHELNSSQQDSVTQIQQYVQQSKSATAAGDSDRAHTLAWKAQLLSQELIKPQQ